VLTAAQFRHWCLHLHLSAETSEVLARLRSAAPSRRVGSRSDNVSGAYASRKMGCTIQFESHKVELWAIYTMEYDSTVLEYYDQPTKLELHYLAKSGRNITVFHTPDFLVLTQEGAFFEEWKHEDRLCELALTQPHRYQRDERGMWRCPPGEAAAELLSPSYRVRSSAELSADTIRNLIFLEDYAVAPTVTPALQARIINQIRGTTGVRLAALLQEGEQFPLDALFTMIAHNQIYVDLSHAPLVERQQVRLYPDKATADAETFLLASHHNEHLPSVQQVFRRDTLAANARLLWDGEVWTLVNFGHTTATLCSEAGSLSELSRSSFLSLMETGKITIPQAVGAQPLQHAHPEVHRLLREASLRDLETANHRYAQLYPSEKEHDVAAEKTSERTLRSWAARFHEAEDTYGNGYVGLLPRTARSGNRKPRVDLSSQELLDTFLQEHFETPTQPHARSVYHAYHRECVARQLPVLSERTFYRRLKARRGPDQTTKRKGTRAAYQETPRYWELTRTTPRHGDRPWEIVHLDHTQLDIEVRTSLGRVLGRPWATFAVDAYSRRILACSLSFDPPSYRSCMMVLRACVQRHQRFPQVLIVDGGPDFHSTYFETLVARYSCTKKTRPGAKPRYGSVIERLFGTTNTEFIHTLRGNTQASKQPRTMTKAVDPKRQAVWQLPDLYQYLCEWAYHVYDQDIHETLGVTPRDAYVTGLEVGGERSHRRVFYDEEFLMATRPSTRKKTAKVVPGQGVKIHYLWYWNDALRHPEVERTQVPVRYDPFDVGIAYAFVRGQWVQCVSQYYAAFHGHSEKELELAAETLRQHARQNHKAASVSPLHLADFLANVHEHERVLVQRLQDQEAKEVFACLASGVEEKPSQFVTTPSPNEGFYVESIDLSTLPVFKEYR